MIGFVNQIYVQAVDQTSIQMAISQATDILARRHRIGPGNINDFSVRNLSQIAETAEGSSRIMALLLAAVASIACGRWHRHHEYPARLRDRTDAGDRIANGVRRAKTACPAALSY